MIWYIIREVKEPLPNSITIQRIPIRELGGEFRYVHHSYVSKGLLKLNMNLNPLAGVILERREVR